VDLDLLNPDPAFQVNMVLDPDPGIWQPKVEKEKAAKNTAKKKYCCKKNLPLL